MVKGILRVVWLCILVWSALGGAVPSVVDPKEAVELYDGAALAITVVNDQTTPITANVSLFIPSAPLKRLLIRKSVPANLTTAIPVSVSLKQLPTGWRVAKGQLIVRLTGVSSDAGKPSAPVVTMLPLTVHAAGTLISSWSPLLWVPLVAASVIIIGLMVFGGIPLDTPMQAAQLKLGESWVTNLGFVSVLAAGIVAALTLDAANTALALIVVAVVTVLLTFAPLLYSGLTTRDHTAPPGALLAASWITLCGAALALTLIYLLIPVLTDTADNLGAPHDVTARGTLIVQVLILVVGAGVALFSVLSLQKALRRNDGAGPVADGISVRSRPALL